MRKINYLLTTLLSLSLFSLPSSALNNSNGIENEENFKINAFRSVSERSGQIFAIPWKYNIVMGDYSHDGFSHIKKNGKIVKFENYGTGHGSPWNYDTHIPIIMYGPGFIQPKKKVERFVTLQDIPVTYSHILNTELPADAEGKVLSEALIKTDRKPKAILTIVMDQVGESYYQKNKGRYPEIAKIKEAGTYFSNAKVTHLESETTVGHVAIGTGAYPDKHGMPANSLWLKGIGKATAPFSFNNIQSPVWLKSPSLADVYDADTDNKAIIVSYCFAERASMGMAGHGAMYGNADKDIVLFYNEKEDRITTNNEYYSLPEYLKDFKVKPYFDSFTNNTGIWMEHQMVFNQLYKKPYSGKERIENNSTMMPVFPVFEGDLYTKIIENEPIGEDDVTDLLYLTFKATDYCSHSFGFESEECGQVLEEADKQVGRVINALEKKVGKDNYIVTITADHGSTPLMELNGGIRMLGDDLEKILNNHFDKIKNKHDVVEDVEHIQIYINERELKRNGYSLSDVKKFLMNYKVNGKNFFRYVFTNDELLKFGFEKEYRNSR